MSMRKCEQCGCLCDPGDLQGGVCDDCREEEVQRNRKAEERRQMLARHITQQEDGQLVMIR